MNLNMTEYKHSTQPPPNWSKLEKEFGVSFENVAVTYGDTVHSKYQLLPDVGPHEAVHVRQQLAYPGGPEAWWDRYMNDIPFRLDQEMQAYRVQYQWIQKNVKDRERRARRVHEILLDLSGEMYGRMLTYSEASAEIKKSQ